jgi:hypothetical protein
MIRLFSREFAFERILVSLALRRAATTLINPSGECDVVVIGLLRRFVPTKQGVWDLRHYGHALLHGLNPAST